MTVKRITERVSQPFAGAAVDRDKGVIRGVKLCGGSSANGRDYPPEVFRRDVLKYERVAIYADHGRDRSVDRKIGWIENPRVDADGTPRGDAHLLKSHPLYERVMEAAERNPAMFGFSHVALCETSHGANGRERVEGLRAIESVDLVAEPATTSGLFESKGNRVAFKVKQLVEWVAKHPKSTTKQITKIKGLCEDDGGLYGGADMADTPDTGPDASTDPDDAISAGFEAALMAVVKQALSGDMDPKAALTKIKTLLAAHCDATDNTTDKGDEGNGGGTAAGTAGTPESIQRKPADPIAVLAECKGLDYDPGVVELKALVLMESTDRVGYIREQLAKKAEASKQSPTSGARGVGRGAPSTNRKTESKQPIEVKDRDSFVKAIT